MKILLLSILRLPVLFLLIVICLLLLTSLSCSNSANLEPNNDSNSEDDQPTPSPPVPSENPPLETAKFEFVAVGGDFDVTDLIDLEFLPGQKGEAIVISQSGRVYYVTQDLKPFSSHESIAVFFNSDERGLLNVEPDPDYAINHFLYFYFTVPSGNENRIDRFTVALNSINQSFSLEDRQIIITFPKTDSPNPGVNHNGGGMTFGDHNELFIGVGDGGGSASSDKKAAVSQNPSTRLGKILRILPNRTPLQGGFQIPQGGNPGPLTALPEIYAFGVRNPFTLTFANHTLFIGDVGENKYEEIDICAESSLNFGWPFEEGPEQDSKFQNPVHFYAHDDQTFFDEDHDKPTNFPNVTGRSVLLGDFITSTQYQNLLNNHLLYTDFYQGWVRALQLSTNSTVSSDEHVAHQTGLSAIRQAPDGQIYALSLFGSSHILKLNLID